LPDIEPTFARREFVLSKLTGSAKKRGGCGARVRPHFFSPGTVNNDSIEGNPLFLESRASDAVEERRPQEV
jgi:hypothetical protein